MARRGKSSVSVLASAPVSVNESERCVSVEVRKIDNGFVTRRTTYGGGEPYKSCEEFSPTAPDLSEVGSSKVNVGREGLREAIKALRE